MNSKYKGSGSRAAKLLFYLYIILLGYFLFFSERYGRHDQSLNIRYNLELFKEIKRYIRYRANIGLEGFIVNILGNIFAFAPFGFLLPIINKRYKKFIYIAFLSLMFSFFIEVLQLYTKVGIFDVDDIFMNTIGGILGYISYIIFFGAVKKKKRSKKQISGGK